MADVRTEVGPDLAAYSRTIHWSAVLGGSFTAMGVWLFLLALGAAIQSGAGVTAWTAVYNLVAPIIALFFGGLVASRSRLLTSRFDGTLHGVVIWGFTMTIGALLLSSMLSVVAAPARAAALPSGFNWAIAGSIFGSLIAAVLGAASATHPAGVRREVARESHT
jgi:hypothetical protein